MATQQEIQAAARQAGYTGAFGGGAAEQWLKSNGKWDAFNGILNQNAQFSGGVVPLTAEPLHQWEKSGLSTIAGQQINPAMTDALTQLRNMQGNPQGFAANYTNPQATQFLTNAGEAAAAGSAPITGQQIQDFANPYVSAVKNRLTEAGERARAALTATEGMRGARSFGDTATGVRQGMLDQELLSKGADIDYQGYQDAITGLQNERNRSLQGASAFGNLATGAQNITSGAINTGLGGITKLYDAGAGITDAQSGIAQNQINAGQYIRNYNQNINDQIGNNMLAEQGYPASQINNILGWLQNYQSGNSFAPTANSLQTAGGIAQGIGSTVNGIGNIGSLSANQVYSRPIGPTRPYLGG